MVAMYLPGMVYTTTFTTTLYNETIPSYIFLTANDRVQVSTGVRDSDNERPATSREVVGGTYIQSGIDVAMEQLTDPNLDTVITEGFQIGTTRTPIMVLMSDGAPTYATNAYNAVGNRNLGSESSTNADVAFVTQLTAAYDKAKIAQKYGNEVELPVKDPTIPKTGDGFNAIVFIAMMVLSSFGLVAVMVCKKHEEEKA